MTQDSKASSRESLCCSNDFGLFSLIFEEQAYLDGPKVRRLSCNVSKVLKVVGDDGSKEVPSKNINFYLCASRSHHSLRRKLGRSRARSLPPLPIFENIPSLLLGNVVVNKDFGFQEWKLLSKAEIFIERKN